MRTGTSCGHWCRRSCRSSGSRDDRGAERREGCAEGGPVRPPQCPADNAACCTQAPTTATMIHLAEDSRHSYPSRLPRLGIGSRSVEWDLDNVRAFPAREAASLSRKLALSSASVFVDAYRGQRNSQDLWIGVSRRVVPRSSSRPARIRDHWAVGRPSSRNWPPLEPQRCGQPSGESSQNSCRP